MVLAHRTPLGWLTPAQSQVLADRSTILAACFVRRDRIEAHGELPRQPCCGFDFLQGQPASVRGDRPAVELGRHLPRHPLAGYRANVCYIVSATGFLPRAGSVSIVCKEEGLLIVDANHDPARRGWLLRTLQGMIFASVVAIFYPVARFLRPRRATASGALEMVAPLKPKDLLNASVKPFDFAGKPCLLVLLPEGAKRLAQGQRLQKDDVRAFNAVCTHVECTVKYRPSEGDIFCSCHDGVYNLDGRNVSGPPPRPLETYKVTLRGEPGQEEIVVSRQT